MVTQVNIHEAKTHLSALIARVIAGEKVTIAKAGRPMVDLVAHRSSSVTIGLGKDSYRHDPDVFDGTDPEIDALFYGSAG